MAREQVMAARNNANQLTADDLGLSPSTEIRRVAIFCHLPPRLQELLHLAKIHQTDYSYKYCEVYYEIIHICTAVVDEVKNDHRSKFSSLSNWKEEA